MRLIAVQTTAVAHLLLLEDAKNGAGADGGVDVGGAVERVEHRHVLAVEGFFHQDGMVFLLGGNHAQLTFSHTVKQRGRKEPREKRLKEISPRS